MFYSIYTIMLSAIILSLIVPSLILRKNPYEVLKVASTKLFTDKKVLFHFVGLFLILYFNKIEQKLGEHLLTSDFTYIIQNWEGNTVYFIQNLFHNDVLTYILTFFYLIGFPTMMISSVIIYLNKEDFKSFYTFIYAFMLNYAIAIPFYLFFPVYEVWFHTSNVHFLIPEVYKQFELEYRPFSGINNNFPSLHTSISTTIALIALRSNSKAFGKVALITAGFIVFSTIYLGIHWITDLSAGILLAIIAVQTGLRISEVTSPQNSLYAKKY